MEAGHRCCECGHLLRRMQTIVNLSWEACKNGGQTGQTYQTMVWQSASRLYVHAQQHSGIIAARSRSGLACGYHELTVHLCHVA